MATTANLNNTPVQVDTTFDDIIVRKATHDIPGGKTLDVTGVADEVLKAGRIVIQNTTSGDMKLLLIVSGNYESLPSGYAYKGILKASILKTKPFASVVVGGEINEAAAVNYGLPAIPAEAKTALTHIIFTKD
ncbi:hypothetical protein JJC03_09200 [Flavobacterium oreochromis]|uniref:hypothetical protein n=1 Tax=Flavobacterium oreochromis TaxID=2906078 RepID=UPI001CE63943|nr:hypothetical protein [Flavobacterium oreochromis]QYS85415.1 hypothetical protein JJC03_09200 [Flavobacterium oreochromis]